MIETILLIIITIVGVSTAKAEYPNDDILQAQQFINCVREDKEATGAAYRALAKVGSITGEHGEVMRALILLYAVEHGPGTMVQLIGPEEFNLIETAAMACDKEIQE